MKKIFFQKTNKKAGFTHTLTFAKQSNCVPMAYCKSKCGGFTIVETIVAVSLFLTIVVIGMGALLNSNLLHQKSRNMRSITDGLSFIMEDMSRNLREGYNYRCLKGADDFSDLITPLSDETCWGVAFESSTGLKSTSNDQWVYYLGTHNAIEGIFKSVDGATTFSALNSEEIVIDLTASNFSVLGAEPPPGDNQQPFIIIKLIGTITSKDVVTPFYLQTSGSQRLIDVVSGV